MSWRMTLNCTISSTCMSLNCQQMTVHVVKLQTTTEHTQVSTSGCMMLNCPPSGCMTLNCPQSMHDAKLQTDDTTHDAFSSITNSASPDDTMYGAFGSTKGTSTRTTPELDRSSSTDSFQTHDSLVTPESPRTYLPSPCESLEEGTMEPIQANDQDTSPNALGTVTQVGTDLLAYDSLVTTLSQLSLEPPAPDPYQIPSMDDRSS